jgi:glycosyltransferase involved in cell wall biosynthesis
VSLSVSVVIVTHNEGDNLRRTVEATRATVPDSTEIVVIDDASTDGSAERLESEPGIVIERPDRPLGISAGRNRSRDGSPRSSRRWTIPRLPR